jgi:hypothetical protein
VNRTVGNRARLDGPAQLANGRNLGSNHTRFYTHSG